MKKITTIIAIALGLMSFIIFTGYRHAMVPSEFKANVSIYPGAEIISSQNLEKSNNVILDVNGTTTDIAKYYMDEMTQKGWAVITIRDNFIAFSKDDKGIMIDMEKVLEKKNRVTIAYITNV